MQTKLECPVSPATVNESAVRATALFVFILTVVYFFIPHWSLACFLAFDFFLRGFNKGRYSLLKKGGVVVARLLSLPEKPANRGAKEFAAQLGFLFADLLFILSAGAIYDVALYVAYLLLLFSFLEAFLGFCAGCYVYTFYKMMKRRGAKKVVAAK